MSHTPHHSPQVCTHERGVGTTVCLHCRKEQRIAARERRKRLMLRGAAGAIVVATGLAASALGATAIRGRNASQSADSAALHADAGANQVAVQATAPSTAPAVVETTGDSAANAPQAAHASAPTPPPAAVVPKPVVRLAPIIPLGPTALPDGVGAVRSDSAVVVSFDIPMIRTRFPDKFERFVRTTLPALYGHAVDSLLARMPTGSFAQQGNLLTELPSRGVRIPIDNASEIRVYPETRMGQDGPLVIRYRATTASR